MKQIILKAIDGKMTAKEFHAHAIAAPSLVSLITRLRKFSSNSKIAYMLDLHSGDYNHDFKEAVSEYYQL
jgi:hypothetical protein